MGIQPLHEPEVVRAAARYVSPIEIGQVWHQRTAERLDGTHHRWEIVALTRNARTPVIAQNEHGDVRAFTFGGRWDDCINDTPLDLVTLIENARDHATEVG